MKKRSLLFISPLILSFSIKLVSAAWDFRDGSQRLIQFLKDIFEPFLEALLGNIGFNEYFYARVLVLILLFVVVLSVTKRISMFKDRYGVRVVVAFVVSILGIRYISETKFIDGVLLPYGILAVTLTVALPFLIYFFFVHDSIPTPAGRKMAWIIFLAVYFGMWIDRADELGNANWMYGIGSIVAALAIVCDNTIHQYFGLAMAAEAKRNWIKHRMADIEAELWRLGAIQNPSQITQDTIKQLEKRRKDLSKKL